MWPAAAHGEIGTDDDRAGNARAGSAHDRRRTWQRERLDAAHVDGRGRQRDHRAVRLELDLHAAEGDLRPSGKLVLTAARATGMGIMNVVVTLSAAKRSALSFTVS
jgi:hypothetical protein